MNITDDFKKLIKSVIGENFQDDNIKNYFCVFSKKILGMRFTDRKVGTRNRQEIVIIYEGGVISELTENNIYILIGDTNIDGDVFVFLFEHASATYDKKVIIVGPKSSIRQLLSEMGYATPPSVLNFP